MMKYQNRLRMVLEGIEGTVLVTLVAGTWPLSKRWLENWGSTSADREKEWPGDQFVAAIHETHTRGVNIAAPAHAVWRWVVQFGLNRAGFFSYELFERLVGIPVKNVESIVPAYQSLRIGDEIQLHPKAPGIPVAALEHGTHVCFGHSDRAPSGSVPTPRRSWSIYLISRSGHSCRLLVRGCIEPAQNPTLLERVGAALEEALDFVMEQRMLRTIRRLAESERSEANAAPGSGYA